MATTETSAGVHHDIQPSPPTRAARHNGRWSGYRYLLWVRVIELKREPEVIFWIFIFPLLLAAGLGIAFRNRPADIPSVVIIAGSGAQKTLAMLEPSNQSSGAQSTIRATIVDRDAALKAFHLASTILRSNPIRTEAILFITIPPARKAYFPAPKSTPRFNPLPDAKMRSPPLRNPRANPDPATSTSSSRGCLG
jgi:hypothetical protein